MLNLDPTDTVVMEGKPRPIDGIDIWPMITSPNTPPKREWLPVTSVSIIYKEQYKLVRRGFLHWIGLVLTRPDN